MFCCGEGAGAASAIRPICTRWNVSTSREDAEYSSDSSRPRSRTRGAAAVVGPAAVVVTRVSERDWARPGDRGKSTVRGDAHDDDGAFAPVR